MSEHDTSWAGARDDRAAAPAPQHTQHEDTSDWRPVSAQPATVPASSAQTPSSPPASSSPTSAAPTSATPTSATTTSAYPSYQPGYYSPPPAYQTSQYPAGGWQQPTHAQGPKPGSGRGGKIAALTAGAVVLALFSGLTGGFIANRFDTATPVTTVTRNSAPVVDRSSVAGVAAKVQPSVVDITTASGEGSGVILSADGAILTNNHVLEGAQGNTVKVTFSSGKTADATVVGTDPAGDLAVIKANGVSGLTAATFGDSDSIQVGDTVLALGSPLGLQGSVTAGIVSALHRTIGEGGGQGGGPQRSIGEAIQTDAAINPGNSGGALVNLAGEVVGINTAIATNGQGAGNIGVGFAIASNKAKSTADQLLKGGKVSHPYLGVSVANGDGGALISDVVAGGPADKAGLRKGDLVVKIGDRTITDSAGLVGAVQAGKSGDQLKITIKRDGNEQQITATLGENS
jgi:putative serine protease PepD